MSLSRFKRLKSQSFAALERAQAANAENLLEEAETFNTTHEILELESQAERKRTLNAIDKIPTNRNSLHVVNDVVLLPELVDDGIPVVRGALVNLFPVSPPISGWRQHEIAWMMEGDKRVSICVTGAGLTQAELDVLLGALMWCKCALDTVTTVNPTEFLRSIGRSDGGTSAKKLMDQFLLLESHKFYYVEQYPDGLKVTQSQSWGIIQNLRIESRPVREIGANRSSISYSIPVEFGRFFKKEFGSWAQIDMSIRLRIDGRKSIVKWLHAYLSGHGYDHTNSISNLRQISGSKDSRTHNFRDHINEAAKQLKAIGFLKSHRVVNNNDAISFYRNTRADAHKKAKSIS